MRLIPIIILLLIITACNKDKQSNPFPTAEEIIQKSIELHDPNRNWHNSIIKLHIQEPRIGNPSRYSILTLDNSTGSFSLVRNRDENTSTHMIDSTGKSTVLFNNQADISEEIIEEYRLTPDRNNGYRSFYKLLIGLPMSLEGAIENKPGIVDTMTFNNQSCYVVPVVLKEEMFSKNWKLFFSKDNFEYSGMEIVFPDDESKGERLYFSGEIKINGMLIPRFRHWHEYATNDYSGSDIIVNNMSQQK